MKQSRLSLYTTLVSRTLWRIESNLADAPSLGDLASAENVSPFHLSRAFTLVTGQPVIGYVRARRLSEAARQLATSGESVLNVALSVGYESPEGFARAFRDMFGIPPKEARHILPSHLQEPLIMENPATTPPEARIVDFKGQSVIGRSERFTMATRPKIPGLWDQTIAEIGARMAGQETFGVCYDFRDDAFNYLVAIANDGDVEGLDQMTIPAGRYAVFDHAGHISQIGDTWQAIFEKWVPTSGEALGEGPEFERYAADFDPNGVGKVSIWIPLKS